MYLCMYTSQDTIRIEVANSAIIHRFSIYCAQLIVTGSEQLRSLRSMDLAMIIGFFDRGYNASILPFLFGVFSFCASLSAGINNGWE